MWHIGEGTIHEDRDASRTMLKVTTSIHQDRGGYWVCQTRQRVRDEDTHRCCEYRRYQVRANHVVASKGPIEEDSTTVAAHRTVREKMLMQLATIGVDEVVEVETLMHVTCRVGDAKR